MDSRRVLYFIDLLDKETDGHKEEIATMYQKALDENDDVIVLKNLIENYRYYSEIGRALLKEGKMLKQNIYMNPSNALRILPQIKQLCEKIQNQGESSEKLLDSPNIFLDTVTVLKDVDTDVYRSVLNKIASSCVYLIALYSGMQFTKNLSWNDMSGIQEMIYAVNTKFLPTLCKVDRPVWSWVIRRGHLGGKALFGGDGFFLTYESPEKVKDMTRTLRCQTIGSHSFLNIGALQSGLRDVPYCWGYGNILPVTPANAISLLQGNVVTKLRVPQGGELQKELPNPIECLRQLTNGAVYCIAPEDLVCAMNQWQIGHEIENRTKSNCCLFCGQYLGDGRLVCSSHFTTEFR